jgi:hypothetical protein
MEPENVRRGSDMFCLVQAIRTDFFQDLVAAERHANHGGQLPSWTPRCPPSYAPPAGKSTQRAHGTWSNGEVGFRAIVRVDGQGRWSKPFTPKNGSTTSWAVTLAERT